MNSGTKEIKKLLKNYCLYRASISNMEKSVSLKQKLDALDNAVNAMDEESKKIVELVFYKRQSVEDAAYAMGYARSTMFYRVNGILAHLSYVTGI